MTNTKTDIIEQIAKYSQKLDQKNFGANHDGNISAKFEDILLATPTAVSKGNVTENSIITLNLKGEKIGGPGSGKVFSEIKLHIAAYEARSDIKAVVHAHPPYATARGLVEKQLEISIPEAIVSIGNIVPVSEFTMPGDKIQDEIIANLLEKYNVFMMPGNGVFSVGVDVEQAYLRLELVEHLTKIQFYAEAMGSPLTLSCENISKLLEKRAAAGLDPSRVEKQTSCKGDLQEVDFDKIKDLIVEEVIKNIRS